jgi:ABC transporter DrrB family efflux protein
VALEEENMRAVSLAHWREQARWTVLDTLVIARRNLLRYIRLPQLLVFSTIQPVMFVLLFAYVFGGAINVGDVGYIDFLLLGILAQTVLFGSIQTGIGLANDLSRGMIERFRSLPMSRSAVLGEGGRILADTVRNSFVLLLLVGVGYAIGFRVHNGFPNALRALALAVFFGISFSWVSAFIGISVREVEATQAASFIPIFPLVFVSSVFVPVGTMPVVLETLANISPVTATVDTMRALALGGPVAESLWLALGWIAGIIIVFSALSVLRYRGMTMG